MDCFRTYSRPSEPIGPTWGSSGPSGPSGPSGSTGAKWGKWAKWAYLGSSGPTWPGGQLRQDLDCFGTYSTHAQTCDNVRVQSATEWSASVHTLHMPKPVITFVFKVLRNGLLRYILSFCTHAQTCDNVRVQSATEWTASVHTLHKVIFQF